MSIVQTIFGAFNGPTGLATALGEPLSTVHAWKDAKHGIPRWRRNDVLSVIHKADPEKVTPEMLQYLRAARPAAKVAA